MASISDKNISMIGNTTSKVSMMRSHKQVKRTKRTTTSSKKDGALRFHRWRKSEHRMWYVICDDTSSRIIWHFLALDKSGLSQKSEWGRITGRNPHYNHPFEEICARTQKNSSYFIRGKCSQKCQESSKACAAATVEQRAAVGRLLSEFKILDKEVEAMGDANNREILQKEVVNAKLQVNSTFYQFFF